MIFKIFTTSLKTSKIFKKYFQNFSYNFQIFLKGPFTVQTYPKGENTVFMLWNKFKGCLPFIPKNFKACLPFIPKILNYLSPFTGDERRCIFLDRNRYRFCGCKLKKCSDVSLHLMFFLRIRFHSMISKFYVQRACKVVRSTCIILIHTDPSTY